MSGPGEYKLFELANKEFTFDVDVSNLPCGLNGAIYFSQMPANGGKGDYADDKAGADYGVGYCDAQCPHDVKFINGEGNSEGWNPSPSDPNAGVGKYGSCCMEFDIWEANSIS
jgi:cellulose 1,4-beta-cellobiosidase